MFWASRHAPSVPADGPKEFPGEPPTSGCQPDAGIESCRCFRHSLMLRVSRGASPLGLSTRAAEGPCHQCAVGVNYFPLPSHLAPSDVQGTT